MKANINITQAKDLLDKYYEGETTLEEEALLRTFLAQDGLPESFDADRAMFGFFAQEKQKWTAVVETEKPAEKRKVKTSRKVLFTRPLMGWSLAAAAILACVFTLNTLFNESSQNYAYINGERYTDTQTIRDQALASMSDFAEEPDEVAESVSGLNDQQLIEDQLHVFAEGL